MQVKGLQFSPLSPHLLASAGMDGELAIWDLSDPRQPKQYPPLKVDSAPVSISTAVVWAHPHHMHRIMTGQQYLCVHLAAFVKEVTSKRVIAADAQHT